jgi:DNA-binding NarL/FixJ family response regulator
VDPRRRGEARRVALVVGTQPVLVGQVGGRRLCEREPGRLDLTTREQEVLRLLVQGLAYKDVAQSLGISLDTARSHVRAIYSKLQVHGVAAAVARAIRDKLV